MDLHRGSSFDGLIPFKTRLITVSAAVWLLGTALVNNSGLIPQGVMVVVPLLVSIYLVSPLLARNRVLLVVARDFLSPRWRLFLILYLVFAVSGGLSALLNRVEAGQAFYFIAMLIALLHGYILGSQINNQFARVFTLAAVAGVATFPLLLMARGTLYNSAMLCMVVSPALFSGWVWGRPAWGMIGSALALSLIVLTSQRTGLVSAIFALLVFAGLRISQLGRKRRTQALLVVVAAAALAGLAFIWQAEQLLSLSDPAKGLAGGFTGRTRLWSMAFALFGRASMIGLGPKAHEFLIQDFVLGTRTPHNGVLMNLVDYGLVGTLPLFLLIVVPLVVLVVRHRRAVRIEDSVLAGQLVFLAGYSIMESYWINLGNPAGILILMGFGYFYSGQGSAVAERLT